MKKILITIALLSILGCGEKPKQYIPEKIYMIQATVPSNGWTYDIDGCSYNIDNSYRFDKNFDGIIILKIRKTISTKSVIAIFDN